MIHKEQSKAALAKLRGLAEFHGITNVAIAEKIGITKQGVGQALAGKYHPTLDNVYRFLNAVNELAEKNYGLKDLAA
jgi:DNA-binding phage protein